MFWLKSVIFRLVKISGLFWLNSVVFNTDTFEVLYTHQVNWSKKPKNCVGQWSLEPEEQPTQKVTSVLRFDSPKDSAKRFERFSILSEGGRDDD